MAYYTKSINIHKPINTEWLIKNNFIKLDSMDKLYVHYHVASN